MIVHSGRGGARQAGSAQETTRGKGPRSLLPRLRARARKQLATPQPPRPRTSFAAANAAPVASKPFLTSMGTLAPVGAARGAPKQAVRPASVRPARDRVRVAYICDPRMVIQDAERPDPACVDARGRRGGCCLRRRARARARSAGVGPRGLGIDAWRSHLSLTPTSCREEGRCRELVTVWGWLGCIARARAISVLGRLPGASTGKLSTESST